MANPWEREWSASADQTESEGAAPWSQDWGNGPKVEKERTFGDKAVDLARTVGAAGVTGIGAIPVIAGRAIEEGGQKLFGLTMDEARRLAESDGTPERAMEYYEKSNRLNPVARAGQAIEAGGRAVMGVADGMRSGRSAEAKQAIDDSTPKGDLFSPSTWQAPANPSFEGMMGVAAEGVGSLIPSIGTAIASRGRSIGTQATMGGAAVAGQIGGAAMDEAGDYLGSFDDAALAAASPVFRNLVEKGYKPTDARALLLREAENRAGAFTAPVGMAGGKATALLLGKWGERVAAGAITPVRAAVLATLGATEEGLQEVAEGMATRAAINDAAGTTRSITEGSLQEFTAGAMGGGPVAGASALVGGGHKAAAPAPTQAPVAPPAPIAPPTPQPSGAEPAAVESVASSDTSAADEALRTPAKLTALDRVPEIDAESTRLQTRLAELTPENGYGQAFDVERAEAQRERDELLAEREAITKTWPNRIAGAPAQFSTEAGSKLDGEYALVNADDLQTSHDANLRANPLYPTELQPRDRSRQASELQVSSIVQRLDPARLGLSADSATGAPIIGDDGLVESGNARTIALKRVYQANGQKALEYRDFLRNNAAQFGLDPAAIDQMSKPVLVRVRKTPVNRAEFARQANASTVARMSSSEQASADARRLASLDGLEPDDSGDFSNSRDFIRQFMATLPITEQGDMVEGDGRLSTTGYRRIQNAVLAKAYGDSPTVRRITESMDDNLRNVSKALTRAAPMIAAARDRIDAGTLHDADVAPSLLAAVEGLSALKDKGWTVDQELSQTDLAGEKYSPEAVELLRMLDENARAPRRIAEFLQLYYEALEQAGDPSQGSLLDDEAPAPAPMDLIQRAKGKTDDNRRESSRAPATADRAAGPGGQEPNDSRGRAKGAQEDAKTTKPVKEGEASDWVKFGPESGTLGIPRVDMPQVKAQDRGALVNFLTARGITHTNEEVDADSLKPTQAEYSKAKTARFADGGDRTRSILVSSDGYVLDGHHQWMATRNDGEQVKIIRFDAPIETLIDQVREFPSVQRSNGAPGAAASVSLTAEPATIDGRPYDRDRDNFKPPAVADVLPDELVKKADGYVDKFYKDADEYVMPDEARAEAIALLAPRMDLARSAKQEFDQKLIDIAQSTGALGQIIAGIKGTKRASEKMHQDAVAEGRDMRADDVKDLLRGTIVVEHYADGDKVLKALRKEFDVLRVKDRRSADARAPLGGYSDMLINVKMPNGTIAEIQVNVPAMLSVKGNQGHKLYEAARAQPDASPRKLQMMASMFELYDAAFSAADRDATADATKADSLTGAPARGPAASMPGKATSDLPSSDALNQPPSGKRTKASPEKSKTNEQLGGNEVGKSMPGSVALQADDGYNGPEEEAQLNAEQPRRQYPDSRQIELEFEVETGLERYQGEPNRSGQTGAGVGRAKNHGIAGTLDLFATGDILGQQLASELSTKQVASLVGKKVRSTAELATLAQVYRDRRFETFRVIFLDKENRVLSQLGMTMRLPAAAPAVGGDTLAYFKGLGGTAEKMGATSFYLLHNHPSGSAGVSMADQNLTKMYAQVFEDNHATVKFAGHVVIDTNEYSVIDRTGSAVLIKKDFGAEPFKREGEFSGTKINGPDDVMALAKKMQLEEGAVTLMLLNHGLEVERITSLPASAFTTNAAANRRLLARHLMRVNASRAIAVSSDLRALKNLNGLVDETIHELNGTLNSMGRVGIHQGGNPFNVDRRARLTPESGSEFEFVRELMNDRAKENGQAVPRAAEPGTKAFDRWFGDSKVVDAKGNPKVAYHGTVTDVTDFSEEFFGEGNGSEDWGDGFYFADKPDVANTYAEGEGANVMPVYLSLKNPAPREVVLSDEVQKAADGHFKTMRDVLEEMGYDGIAIEHAGEGTEYVAFRPGQIKSAIGNDGSYDPNDASVVRAPQVPLNMGAPAQKDASARAEDIINSSALRAAPIDAIAKAVSRYSGLDRLAGGIYRRAAQLLSRVVPEKVKAGLVSDYGVPEAVIDQRIMLQGRQRVQLRKTGQLIEKLATLTREESRVAYEWMNMDGSDPKAYMSKLEGMPEESVMVLQDVQKMIDDLSVEAVRLGQLSKDAFERNRFAYLRRSYAKHILEESKTDKAKRARTIAVLGEQYKGRGLVKKTTMASMKAADPEWWNRKIKPGKADTQLKGEKFIRLERYPVAGRGTQPLAGMSGPSAARPKPLEVVYWPAGEKIPTKYDAFTRADTWEVRTVTGGDVVLWRDFTKDEREKMGEIDEARFAIAKTLHAMVHDVEVGRYLEWLAKNQSKAEGVKIPGTVVEASERLRDSFAPDEWVKVPDTKIQGTDVLKYGKLAGRYMPGPVWNDLRQVVGGAPPPLGETYQKLLTMWKTSKTALSPAVHMNNVMSNFVMADWQDVRATHVSKALRIVLAASGGGGKGVIGRSGNALASVGGIADKEAAMEILNRYKDAGGDVGSWVTNEIARDQLDPLLADLEKELVATGGQSVEAQTGVFAALQHAMQLRFPEAWTAFAASKGAKAVATEGGSLIDLYQREDDVFRLAAWLKAKEDGLDDLEAGKLARKSFLDYNVNAPWIQAMRKSAWPFISFTYRAVPLLIETAAKRPHKLLKLMAIAGGLNALGAMLAGGDDDEEERARKLLPDEKAGRIWGLVPKLIRMPWNDAHGSPVFLDIRRWIPVGDVLDVGAGNSAIPMLPGLMPGGPLMIAAEVLPLNMSAFTGKPIVMESDTPAQKAAKITEHLYKAFMPNVLGVPGTYATTGVVGSMTGRTDAFGRELSPAQAVSSAFGVKLGSYPVDVLKRNVAVETQVLMSEIDRNISGFKRQYATRRIDKAEFDKLVKTEVEKKKELAEKMREKVN